MTDPWQSVELSAFQFEHTEVVCMKNKMGQVEQCPLTVLLKNGMKPGNRGAVFFFFPKEMAPIQTLTGDTNELECLKSQPLHFDTSADRCKNIHS